MQADAYVGFNRLYEANRKPGPIVEAACWAHGRRKFFDLEWVNKAPIATESVERIDALFAIERVAPCMKTVSTACAHHVRATHSGAGSKLSAVPTNTRRQPCVP